MQQPPTPDTGRTIHTSAVADARTAWDVGTAMFFDRYSSARDLLRALIIVAAASVLLFFVIGPVGAVVMPAVALAFPVFMPAVLWSRMRMIFPSCMPIAAEFAPERVGLTIGGDRSTLSTASLADARLRRDALLLFAHQSTLPTLVIPATLVPPEVGETMVARFGRRTDPRPPVPTPPGAVPNWIASAPAGTLRTAVLDDGRLRGMVADATLRSSHRLWPAVLCAIAIPTGCLLVGLAVGARAEVVGSMVAMGMGFGIVLPVFYLLFVFVLGPRIVRSTMPAGVPLFAEFGPVLIGFGMGPDYSTTSVDTVTRVRIVAGCIVLLGDRSRLPKLVIPVELVPPAVIDQLRHDKLLR